MNYYLSLLHRSKMICRIRSINFFPFLSWKWGRTKELRVWLIWWGCKLRNDICDSSLIVVVKNFLSVCKFGWWGFDYISFICWPKGSKVYVRINKIYRKNFPSAWTSDEYIHLEKSKSCTIILLLVYHMLET